MTVDQIKSEAELYLSFLQDQILPLQASFLLDNGKYWIGESTPEPIPEDGSIGNPNPNASHSGYPSWSDFGATVPGSAPFAVLCNSEKWPNGDNSFSVGAVFGWNGGTWMGKSTHNFQISSWATIEWYYTKFQG